MVMDYTSEDFSIHSFSGFILAEVILGVLKDPKERHDRLDRVRYDRFMERFNREYPGSMEAYENIVHKRFYAVDTFERLIDTIEGEYALDCMAYAVAFEESSTYIVNILKDIVATKELVKLDENLINGIKNNTLDGGSLFNFFSYVFKRVSRNGSPCFVDEIKAFEPALKLLDKMNYKSEYNIFILILAVFHGSYLRNVMCSTILRSRLEITKTSLDNLKKGIAVTGYSALGIFSKEIDYLRDSVPTYEEVEPIQAYSKGDTECNPEKLDKQTLEMEATKAAISSVEYVRDTLAKWQLTLKCIMIKRRYFMR